MPAGACDLFCCPACGGSIDPREGAGLVCGGCGAVYPVVDGIPRLLPADAATGGAGGSVTERVRAFYERSPFPDYDDLDSPASLRDKARRGLFSRLLDEQLPHDARVLEVGCGTGQLSNFLALTWGRLVFGADLSLASLALAQRFKTRHGVERATFLQANLFRPPFRPGSFDLVIANGVLHHTADPAAGLASLAGLVKRGGHVIVGLYNAFGRLPTDARRVVFRFTGGRFTALDPRLRRADVGQRQKDAWFADQYQNPHESKHTIGEVLRWFDRMGLEYVNGIPKPRPWESFSPDERLFEPHEPGSPLSHFAVQVGLFLRGGPEGGFFLMIGRRS